MRIDLIKYQALGNDYLVLDLPGPLDQLVPLLPRLCDRFRGLGSDGPLVFDPNAMTVRIFNPDGSEAQKSGHGLRITAAPAGLEDGAADKVQLLTVDRANGARALARNRRARARVEIWERGAGYTLASGTSASAVAAACMRAGLVDDRVVIQMPGGGLEIHRTTSGNLIQSGPARRVYRAHVDLADFEPEQS